nr:MAG: internal scaffolding protein [Microvirus sp.]
MTNKPFIHSLYELPFCEPVKFKKPSLTQQHFKDECDINCIMDRYASTGVLTNGLSTRAPIFDDFSVTFDYHSAKNKMIEAEMLFMELPARVRDAFENNPENLLRFIANEENREEAIELGLISRPQANEMVREAVEKPREEGAE